MKDDKKKESRIIDTELMFQYRLDDIFATGLLDNIYEFTICVSFETHRRIEWFCGFNTNSESYRYNGRNVYIKSNHKMKDNVVDLVIERRFK